MVFVKLNPLTFGSRCRVPSGATFVPEEWPGAAMQGGACLAVLSCHEASLAIKPVFDRFQLVVITSGTLIPINLYPRLLNFHLVVSRSFKISLARDCICPMVLTRGSDQLLVITKFDMRSNPGVARNYRKLLVEMVSIVPVGIVFFC
ncbi:hypothetical protein Dsin_025199 [Dipteronia sinensis]|uniref:Uncharacterized protein n=1 Tax=Dipteronia sinensis TaxID=43782 RepID=A0AAD9ZWI1_9ROSI|nr:hypothetical protein Dsin_025199 [Dipteronia sinensis]